MIWWVKDIYRWVLKLKRNASDLGVTSKGDVIHSNILDKMSGSMTLQEFIDRLQDEDNIGS